MGMQNTQASYPRVCTHESQSFSTKLLESKGAGSKHLTHTCHLLPRQLFFFNLSYMVAFWRHNLNQVEKIGLQNNVFCQFSSLWLYFFRKKQKTMQLFFCLAAI